MNVIKMTAVKKKPFISHEEYLKLVWPSNVPRKIIYSAQKCISFSNRYKPLCKYKIVTSSMTWWSSCVRCHIVKLLIEVPNYQSRKITNRTFRWRSWCKTHWHICCHGNKSRSNRALATLTSVYVFPPFIHRVVLSPRLGEYTKHQNILLQDAETNFKYLQLTVCL